MANALIQPLFYLLALFFWDTERKPLFEEIPASRSGISFVHHNALSPTRYLPESMGPGVAVFDFDNDGWMDLYFPNSGSCDFFQPRAPLRNALYRNNHDGTFTDVTEKAGVAGRDFGLGAATADYDGDGRTDLLVTNYGVNVLYRNNGDGTFSDVTKKAGLDAPGLWTAAVWFDYDGNGTLDLFVGHFARFSQTLEHKCEQNGVRHYCHPVVYDPWPSRLYRNNGNGTFSDVSAASGIGKHAGKTFGAVATDINNDGWLDLFVANDSEPNFLFVNQGDGQRNGTFREIGFAAEVAFNPDGAARSGMGVDAADYDEDGREDLFVANFNHERFSLYRNRGDLSFSDEAGPTGIGAATRLYSGWGLRFFDFDLDGDQDLIVCNGHPDDMIETINTTLTHKEPILLFEKRGREFVNLGAAAGAAFTRNYPARGLAVGDLNNDGQPDVVITSNGEAPVLLRHTGATANHWLGLHLRGLATGARITWSAGGIRRSRLKTAGGSYLSSHDPRELLGCGVAKKIDWLEVRWPGKSGRVDRFENLTTDKYFSLKAGGKLE
ncbi:MAG: CRTAC1 family protein [Blastocatellia bacterium]